MTNHLDPQLVPTGLQRSTLQKMKSTDALMHSSRKSVTTMTSQIPVLMPSLTISRADAFIAEAEQERMIRSLGLPVGPIATIRSVVGSLLMRAGSRLSPKQTFGEQIPDRTIIRLAR